MRRSPIGFRVITEAIFSFWCNSIGTFALSLTWPGGGWLPLLIGCLSLRVVGNDAQHFEDTVIVALTPDNTATVTNKNLSSATNTFPSSLATLTGTQTLTNKTLTTPIVNNPRLKSPEELTSVSATAATGTINFDAAAQGDLYYTTNASGNWTLNVRGDSSTTLSSMLDVGDSITVTFKVTNGATAYYQTAFQIDGSTVTPKWQGGLAPTGGNASSVDVYTFNIVKTAATPTYTVFASQTKFV